MLVSDSGRNCCIMVSAIESTLGELHFQKMIILRYSIIWPIAYYVDALPAVVNEVKIVSRIVLLHA